MAEIALKTTVPEVNDRGYGFGAKHTDNLVITAHTTAAYEYVTAPADCVLKAVTFSASVTSSVSVTYALGITNESNSSAAMIATTLYDADPVLTAGTAAEVTLSSTAANLVVEKGDIIKIGGVGGTASGLWGVVLEWELF